MQDFALDRGLGTGEAGIMEWYRDPVLAVVRRDPPARGVPWEGLILALRRLGYRVVETEGYHMSVEHGGRMARFHHAIAHARGYQLVALRRFLERAE